MTVAMGDTAEMQKAIEMLSSVKDSIINAYEIKTGLSRTRLSHLMDAETWMNGAEAAEYFDFEVEEDVNAAACASDFFGTYKNTPESVKKQKDSSVSAEKIADMVIERLESRKRTEEQKKTDDMKKEILEDLDMYGI